MAAPLRTKRPEVAKSAIALKSKYTVQHRSDLLMKEHVSLKQLVVDYSLHNFHTPHTHTHTHLNHWVDHFTCSAHTGRWWSWVARRSICNRCWRIESAPVSLTAPTGWSTARGMRLSVDSKVCRTGPSSFDRKFSASYPMFYPLCKCGCCPVRSLNLFIVQMFHEISVSLPYVLSIV